MLLATPEHKVVVTYFVSAGRFSSFLRSKRTWRKACKRIYDKSIKVKNCGGIQGRADPAPTVTPSGVPPKALRHSFGELKFPSSQALLRFRNAPLRHGDNIRAGRPSPYGLLMVAKITTSANLTADCRTHAIRFGRADRGKRIKNEKIFKISRTFYLFFRFVQ